MKSADIVFAGGGTAGLTAALAIARSAPGIAIEVIDAKPPAAASGDRRASAIAAAARRMLEQLGVWDAVASEAEPILSMEITDSRLGDAVRPVFLTFDGAVAEGEPFAHMVANEALGAALRDAALAAGITLTAPDTVSPLRGRRRRHANSIGLRWGAPRRPARRGRRRALEAAGARRHQDGDLDLSADGDRRDGEARASAQRRGGRAFPAERTVRHPADDGQPLVAGLDGAQGRGRAAHEERRLRLSGRARAPLRAPARSDRARGASAKPIRCR